LLTRVALSVLCMLLCAAPLAGQDATNKAAAEVEAERLLRQLVDPNLRDSALESLSKLGPRARPALERAVHDPDPDVRFHALYLLELEDVDLRRSIRMIVEGNGVDSGTYPEARQAFEALVGTRPADGEEPDPLELERRAGLRGMLIRYALRQARRGHPLHVSVALDVLAGVIEVDRERLVRADAEAVAHLLDVELGDACWELPRVFGAFRWEVALPVLRSRLSGGSGQVTARAARTLGECAPGGAGQAALEALAPALKHRAPQARYAAVRAVGKLNLDDELLLPWVGLTRDPHPRVAAAMLRVGAERGLAVIREPAEQWAADPQTPERLRLTAVITLGMLGEGSPKLLEGIAANNGGDLALAAVWALGASGAEGAPRRILEMANHPQWAHENALYSALGRAGTPEALEVLRQLERIDPAMALLHGYSRLDNVPLAVGEIMRFATPPNRVYWVSAAEALSVLYARRAIESNPEPIRVAMAKLYNSTEPRDTDRDKILAEVRRVGAPASGSERAELIRDLRQRIRGERSQLIPQVLATIAPKVARESLRPLLEGRRVFPGQAGDWYLRELARALAIAGERSYIRRFALPASKNDLAQANADNRSNEMNNVGIDYLYAQELDEAAITFRQMLWCEPEDNIAAYNLACGAALGGDVDGALLFLRRSLRNGYTNERHIRSDSDLDLLHGDRRFERIFRRLLLRSEVRLPIDPEAQGSW